MDLGSGLHLPHTSPSPGRQATGRIPASWAIYTAGRRNCPFKLCSTFPTNNTNPTGDVAGSNPNVLSLGGGTPWAIDSQAFGQTLSDGTFTYQLNGNTGQYLAIYVTQHGLSTIGHEDHTLARPPEPE